MVLSIIDDSSMNNEIQVPGNWKKVDFHIHTPASVDYELGGKSSEEAYLNFIETIFSSNLDVAIIADHNDISGYKKIKEILEDLKSTKKTLELHKQHVPDDISNQLEQFNNTIFLPGVELDVYPNLHIIVIFDPQREINEIECFLSLAGFEKDSGNQSLDPGNAKFRVQDVYREAEKIGAIVIAAHVDSDKGLYHETRNWGQNRISAFTSDALYAMEFNNPKQRDVIKSILSTQDYFRNTKLSFVQSSDFHGREDNQLGNKITWVRLDVEEWSKETVFHELQLSLRNPDEYVSAPGRPEIKAIQESLIDYPAIIDINSDDLKDKLLKYVCAFSNTEDGTIVLGRNEQGNWIGITGDKNELRDDLEKLIINSVRPIPKYNIQVYPYYEDRCFATIRIKKMPSVQILLQEDKVYYFDSNQPKCASISKVVELAEENFLQRYNYLSITPRLNPIAQKLKGSRDSIDIIPIVRKIESKSRPLGDMFDSIHFGDELNESLYNAVDYVNNGYKVGNVILLNPQRPREVDHYIRVTAPLGRYNEENDDFSKFEVFSGEKILISPMGAVYYDHHDGVIALCDKWPPIVLLNDDNYNGPEFKFLIAYLKSSIPIWYSERCLGSYDIRLNRILYRLPVPVIESQEIKDSIISLVDELIALEYEYLDWEINEEKAYSGYEELPDEYYDRHHEFVTDHNDSARIFMLKIDDHFSKIFGITSDEYEIIQSGLDSSGFLNNYMGL